MKVDWLAVRGPVIASAFCWLLPLALDSDVRLVSMGPCSCRPPAVFSAGDQVPCCWLSPAIWLMCGLVFECIRSLLKEKTLLDRLKAWDVICLSPFF